MIQRAGACWCGAMFTVALALTGCGGDAPLVAPLPPLEAFIEISTRTGANPDSTGRPSPVVVHLHAVRDPGPAMSSDFDAVVAQPSPVLAPVLVMSQALTLRPGEQRELRWRIAPDVMALVVVAEFRDPNASQWRAALPIPAAARAAGSPLAIAVGVDADRVGITLDEQVRTN